MTIPITNDYKHTQFVKIGGGGWLVQGHMCSNGDLLATGDVCGVFRLKSGTTSWEKLLAASKVTISYTPSVIGRDSNSEGWGGYSVASCAANPQAIGFAWCGRVYYRTADTDNFVQLNFALPTTQASNSNGNIIKGIQRKMAIDPINSNCIYVGWAFDTTGAQGLHYTTDKGVTCTQSNLPIPLTNASLLGVGAIFIDPNSTNVGSGSTLRKSRLITSSHGRGTYYSTDGGVNWTLIAGSPTLTIYDMAIDSNGNIWATYEGGQLWKILPNNTMSNFTTSMAGLVATNGVTTQGTRIIVHDYEGRFYQSIDGGASWVLNNKNYVVLADDSAWVATQTGLSTYLSSTWAQFDPVNTGKIWTIGGQGILYSSIPTANFDTTQLQWHNLSDGIEEAVANHIHSLPNGQVIFNGWDVGAFDITKPFKGQATRYYPPNSATIFDVSTSAHLESNPLIRAYTVSIRGGTGTGGYSRRSTDGGVTWLDFTNYPPFGSGFDKGAGGELRPTGPTQFVWQPSHGDAEFRAYYTADAGATAWQLITLPGINTGATSPSYKEINAKYYWKRHILAVDPVIAGKVYLYHYVAGTFVSTNYGAPGSWSLASSTTFAFSNVNSKMKTMWDRGNTLFATSGSQLYSDPPNGDFAYSTNGATSWTVHPDIKEVVDFDWGAKLNGQSYPTLYFVGYVNHNTIGNNGYGLYASDDNLANVRRLNSGPIADSLDSIVAIGASREHRDLCYIGFGGSSVAAVLPSVQGKIPIFHQ